MDKRVPIRFVEKQGKNNFNDYKNKPQFKAFSQFVQKYPDYCLQMDGILDNDIWEADDLHIMFLLKDSYRTENFDYLWSYVIDNCKNMSAFKDKTWRKIFQWLPAIREALGFKKELTDISSIAYMNLSKLAFDYNIYGSRTQPKVLKSAVENDSELLYQQLKEISPKIIVCCGVSVSEYLFKLIAKAIGIKRKELKPIEISTENRNLYVFSLYNIIIFSVYHPACNKTKSDDFASVITKYNTDLCSILKKDIELP